MGNTYKGVTPIISCEGMGGTIISTFGESPGGTIASIKQNGCEKLILVLSKDLTPKAKKGLERVEDLAKQLKINLEKVEVSPYALMENIQKIKQLIAAQDGNEVILNVTGGRKPLSLAATLAGFVANPSKIIYIQEENDQPIEIPKFTLGNKLLRPEKMKILKCVKNNTTVEEIRKKLGNKKYHTIMKHLRELEEAGLIKLESKSNPHRYSITPSGELLG